MRARISIEVQNRQQARAIERGLSKPDVRAFVITVAILDGLPSDRARERVLRFLFDYVGDPDNAPRAAPPEAEADV